MLKCQKVDFFVKSTFFLKNVKISKNHFLGWLEDEPDMIPDEDAIKPDDWDEEMDGEWEAPLVPNPLCQSAPGCGKWRKPMIDNPLYKGKWFPPMINNPNYKVSTVHTVFDI